MCARIPRKTRRVVVIYWHVRRSVQCAATTLHRRFSGDDDATAKCVLKFSVSSLTWVNPCSFAPVATVRAPSRTHHRTHSRRSTQNSYRRARRWRRPRKRLRSTFHNPDKTRYRRSCRRHGYTLPRAHNGTR